VEGSPRAGDAIDEDLARRVHAQICDPGVAFDDLSTNERDQLLVRCERAKCELSSAAEAHIWLPEYAGKSRTIPVSRDFCRPAIEPYVRGAIEMLARAISRAGLSVDAIDEIIVIGGSSRLWLLREMLESDPRFQAASSFPDKPEWDVARGASVVDRHPGSYSLAETIGLELSDGSYFELARPGDAPCERISSVNLALVEDVRAANVVIDRWTPGYEAQRELASQFSVPTLGFDQEAVDLSWNITEDLTMAIEGRSPAYGNDSIKREISRLRFGYRINQT
jgi:molecular chaperone DnaK